jgi:hypothetical protein
MKDAERKRWRSNEIISGETYARMDGSWSWKESVDRNQISSRSWTARKAGFESRVSIGSLQINNTAKINTKTVIHKATWRLQIFIKKPTISGPIMPDSLLSADAIP